MKLDFLLNKIKFLIIVFFIIEFIFLKNLIMKQYLRYTSFSFCIAGLIVFYMLAGDSSGDSSYDDGNAIKQNYMSLK